MDKSIVITGANRGIGLELVRCFAAEGWQALARIHGGVRLHRLDVVEATHVRELAASLDGRPIDILFNNAGIFGPRQQTFGQTDVVRWLEVFQIDVIAMKKMVEALVENLAKITHRLIANMGSMLGCIQENRSGGMYLYRTAKAAVSMLTKCQASDLRDRGIIAVVLHPGWVRNRMGGPEAPVAPEESAKGLFQVLTALTTKDSGRFFTYQGETLPW
jgi:NAD(P)-dependent dehydrogenase (short-subunit alcohol dehydrogenase family)